MINLDNSIKNTKTEYNEIADKYQEATKRQLREFTYNPSWVKLLGDIKGKKALDLACGEGVSSRLLRELDAGSVIGVDISEELIKKANTEEEKIDPNKKIKYIVGDVCDLPVQGKFDIITGAMMINYCSSKEILKKMLTEVKNCLSEDGTFFASIPNPERMKGSDSYGVRMTPKTSDEGSEVKIELSDFQGSKYCEFTNYYWPKETYENIFHELGFNIEWIPSLVSDEGIQQKGDEFWEEYRKNPIYVMIKARLKK